MKTFSSKFILGLLLVIALPLWIALSPPMHQSTNCNPPTNLVKTNHTDTTISFSWSGSGNHVVKYLRHSDGYASPDIPVVGTTYTFSELSAGTYTFYFATDCGDVVSEFIITEDVING